MQTQAKSFECPHCAKEFQLGLEITSPMVINKPAGASHIRRDDKSESGWLIIGGCFIVIVFLFIYALLERWSKNTRASYRNR